MFVVLVNKILMGVKNNQGFIVMCFNVLIKRELDIFTNHASISGSMIDVTPSIPITT